MGASEAVLPQQMLNLHQCAYLLAHTKMPSSWILWSHSQLGRQAEKLINAEMAVPTPQPWKWLTLHLLINLHYIGPDSILPYLTPTNTSICFLFFSPFCFCKFCFTDNDNEVKTRKH